MPLREIEFEDEWVIRLRLTKRVSHALDAMNVFLGYDEVSRPDENRILTIPKHVRFEEYTSFHEGQFFGLGAFSYSETARLEVTAGRYCSIAGDVTVFGERHPMEWATTSSLTYCYVPGYSKPQFARAHRTLLRNRFEPAEPPEAFVAGPIIGNDVWIGSNVMLARGIRIGTGAIIGAGSIVTRSVPPYTIVAGNPARPIRPRFSDRIAQKLLESRWWEYHPELIWDCDYQDPEAFADNIIGAREAGDITPFPYRQYMWGDILSWVEWQPE